jgi:hypothetical protein
MQPPQKGAGSQAQHVHAAAAQQANVSRVCGWQLMACLLAEAAGSDIHGKLSGLFSSFKRHSIHN